MQRVGTWRTRRGVAVLAALVAIAAVLFTLSRGQEASATPSSALVVNEVYGGGGNSGATLTNDFIELAQPQHRAGDRRRVVGPIPLRQRHRQLGRRPR